MSRRSFLRLRELQQHWLRMKSTNATVDGKQLKLQMNKNVPPVLLQQKAFRPQIEDLSLPAFSEARLVELVSQEALRAVGVQQLPGSVEEPGVPAGAHFKKAILQLGPIQSQILLSKIKSNQSKMILKESRQESLLKSQNSDLQGWQICVKKPMIIWLPERFHHQQGEIPTISPFCACIWIAACTVIIWLNCKKAECLTAAQIADLVNAAGTVTDAEMAAMEFKAFDTDAIQSNCLRLFDNKSVIQLALAGYYFGLKQKDAMATITVQLAGTPQPLNAVLDPTHAKGYMNRTIKDLFAQGFLHDKKPSLSTDLTLPRISQAFAFLILPKVAARGDANIPKKYTHYDLPGYFQNLAFASLPMGPLTTYQFFKFSAEHGLVLNQGSQNKKTKPNFATSVSIATSQVQTSGIPLTAPAAVRAAIQKILAKVELQCAAEAWNDAAMTIGTAARDTAANIDAGTEADWRVNQYRFNRAEFAKLAIKEIFDANGIKTA